MKYVFIAIVVFFMVVNVPLGALEIEKHDMFIGVEIENTFSDDDTVQGYALTVPYLSHSFEPSVTENISFSVDSEISFILEKIEADDESGNSIDVSTEPALEWSLTEEISLGETLSFEFSNYKSSEEDVDRENFFELSSFTELSFSKMEEDLPGISP
jgi:hypothetical protein